MNRHLLRVIVALGLVITVVGGTGVFAVFSDRATAGAQVDTGQVARAADLQLAVAVDYMPGGQWNCGAGFIEDLTTAIDMSGAQPNNGVIRDAALCLRNVGSAMVAPSLSVTDLADVELGCSGDEAIVDPDCAAQPGGQLSPLLRISVMTQDCTTGAVTGTNDVTLTSLVGAAVPIFGPEPTDVDLDGIPDPALASNATICVLVGVEYPTSTAANDVQAAQTDQATWTFAFDGVAY